MPPVTTTQTMSSVRPSTPAPAPARAATPSPNAPDPIFLPPGAAPPGPATSRRDYANDGYDAAARKRVDGWIDDARAMFERAGVADPDRGKAPRVEWALGLPAAHWNVGTNTLLLGEVPDTRVPFSRSRDVVAHEYAHSVLAHAFGFGEARTLEAATLHESLADTFAAVLDRDWKMGEDLYPREGGGQRFTRSMDDPGSAPAPASYGVTRLPAHMREWVWRTENGHVNMGVPSRAAALIGTTLGRPRMAQLYATALRDHMGDTGLTVAGLAAATLKAAAGDGRATSAVRDAWTAVGVDLPTTSA